MKRLVLAALLAVPAASFAQSSTWDIDSAHSHVSFTVKHMAVSNVRGEFQKVSGKIVLDEKDVSRSSVEANIDPASINTREPKRDAHLRSPDFFDVEKNKTLTFKSTKVEKAGDGKLKVTGDLTMNGVTKPVVLEVTGPTAPVKSPYGKTVRGIAATTTLDRKDFGLTWNRAIEAGPVVGDEVKVEIEAELVKQDGPAPSGAAK